jgi:heterodisulfide reductase subunit A2
MMDVGRHPLIELLTLTEVEEVNGYIGNFKVKVRQKARYVDEKECTACGECVEVCPVTYPDEYQIGLGTRKAIHIPFAQAVPSSYVINSDNCLGSNPIACGKCAEKCQKQCIDFDMQDKLIELEVGAIIVATGMDVYDPTEMDEYGYTRFQNVVTSMEFERLICASGPTEGHFVRPGDRTTPKRIGFVQCVGSRMENRGNPYCSNICCMNTVKDSLLLKEHYPDTEIFVFYIDMRAFGKGFEDLFKRSRELGVNYVRGLPGSVIEDPDTGNLIVDVENTTAGRLEQYNLDMLVLSVGLEPREDGDPLRQALNLSKTSDGFLLEAHPKLRPVDASTPGIFLAGCVEAPKDVKDSVTQASAAVARASTILNADTLNVEAITAVVDKDKCTACGACVRVCPYGAIKFDKEKKTPAEVIEAMCAGCGTCAAECRFDAINIRHFSDDALMAQTESAVSENANERIVVFACNWCSYAGGDGAGTSRLQYPPNARIIRTMCSGRVDEKFILRAFELGAPIVLVSGCHFADCHYIDANRATQRRVDKLWNKLEKLGIRPERLQLEWISAAEGQKFAVVMRETEEMRKAVTLEEIEHTKNVLKEDREKQESKRKAKDKV